MAKSWKYKRIRKAGTLEELKLKTWQAILECERIILEEKQTDAQKLQAIHAMNSSGKAYLKLLEFTDLEERLTKLEVQMRS